MKNRKEDIRQGKTEKGKKGETRHQNEIWDGEDGADIQFLLCY